MGVFGGSPYGTQTAAKTPNFVGANATSAAIQMENQRRKDAAKQQNLQGGFSLANALREGGTEGGGSVIGDMGSAISQGWKGAGAAAGAAPGVSAGASVGANAAMTGGAAVSPYAAGATVPGAGMVAGGGGLGAGSALAGSTAAATAPVAAAAPSGVSGAMGAAGGALASNPVGWAAMAALAAYSLFG